MSINSKTEATQANKTEFSAWENCLGWMTFIVFIQVIALWKPWLSLLTIFPLVKLINIEKAGRYDSNRPTRFYFACLLIAITSIAGEIFAICSAIETAVGVDEFTNPLMVTIKALPRLALRIVAPAAVGLVGLTTLLHFDIEEETDSSAWITKLDGLLGQSDVPQEVSDFLQTLSARLQNAGDQYLAMTSSAESTAQSLNDVSVGCNEFTDSLAKFASVMRGNEAQLASLRTEVNGARSDLKQIKNQVGEMGQVLEEFSTIANHHVLQYQPRELANTARDQESRS